MCGIAGIYDFTGRPVAVNELKRMGSAIAHRGPDDEGQYVDGAVGLANRRLAIIDPTPAGHQPMSNSDGSVVIAYNGEVYNFLDLMPLLEARGHRFHSRTDTEVVLHAYEEWGERCLDRLNGMFALAIWDRRRRRMFLARDRFGIKPLYVAEQDGRLLFGSEIKSLLAAGLKCRVDNAALVEYFTFQNIFSANTLFADVKMLPAGHYAIVDDRGLRSASYWDLEFEPDHGRTEDEWATMVREAFESSVVRQLVSDVPLGSYLSGGMDSGSIVAVASRNVPRLMTFTGGFDLSSVEGLELVFDERRDAEAMSNAFHTEHYEMVMHAGDMAWILPELVWHLEDLRVGMSYQNYYIARLGSRFVKVSLAGTGGDEMFAGYPWRYALAEGDQGSFEDRYYAYWSRLIPEHERGAFFSPKVLRDVVGDPRDAFREVLRPVAGLEPLEKALYFEAKTFLHGLLVVEDRVSMANSLEVRVPFLDNEIVDVARRIPARRKHADDAGKQILRRAMEPLLPQEIASRPKQGFSPPDRSWYRGPTMDYIRDLLLDPRTLERGYFQPAFTRRMLDEHLEGRVNHRLLIWSLMTFEWWNRLFIDGERPHVGFSDSATGTAPRS